MVEQLNHTDHPSTVIPSPEQQFTRRIGSTTYRVAVHFSDTSRETMNDKITRMIRNETAVEQ